MADVHVTPRQHIAGAEENLAQADTLHRAGTPTSMRWAVTALFYSALHEMRAYAIAAYGHRVTSHEGWRKFEKNHPELRRTASQYDLLKQYSQTARYYLEVHSDQDFAKLRERVITIKNAWRGKTMKRVTPAGLPHD